MKLGRLSAKAGVKKVMGKGRLQTANGYRPGQEQVSEVGTPLSRNWSAQGEVEGWAGSSG